VNTSAELVRTALGMAREAERAKQTEIRSRRETQRRLEQLRRFCDDYGIDFEIVRTEAKGHGPGKAGVD
jgi:hypothetical protein